MFSNKPLVSIITPFLDAGEFLQEAIDSVSAQTYENWELLLIDDGSTDGSTAIAKAACKQYPAKIRYLQHQQHANRGKSASRNLGLANAQGEFIAFLDADDVWMPFKLEKQVPLLLSQPGAGMLYGTSLFWHFSTSGTENVNSDFVQDLGVELNTVYPPAELLAALLDNEDIHPTNCSMLVRRQVCEKVGGFDEKVEYMYGDTVFLAKLYLKESVFVVDDCSAVYRLHRKSTCHRGVEEGMYHPTRPNPARGAFLTWLQDYLTSERVDDERLWRSLNRELFPYTHPLRYRLTQPIADVGARGARRMKRLVRRGLATFVRSSRPVSHSGPAQSAAGPNLNVVAVALDNLAQLYKTIGRDAEAELVLQRARSLR